VIATVAPTACSFVFFVHRPQLEIVDTDPHGDLLLLTAALLELAGRSRVACLLRTEFA